MKMAPSLSPPREPPAVPLLHSPLRPLLRSSTPPASRAEPAPGSLLSPKEPNLSDHLGTLPLQPGYLAFCSDTQCSGCFLQEAFPSVQTRLPEDSHHLPMFLTSKPPSLLSGSQHLLEGPWHPRRDSNGSFVPLGREDGRPQGPSHAGG